MTTLEKQLTKEVSNLSEKNQTLECKIKILEEQIQQFRREKFGQKREKMPENPDELLDWQGELDKLDTVDEEEVVEIEVKASTRKKRKTQDYAAFLKGLRREKILHDLPQEEKKGLVCIAEDEYERLAYTPPEYYVKVHVVRKYAVAGHSSAGIIVPNVPKSAVSGAFFDESFYSELLVRKFADHLPLYRLEGIFNREGLPLKRQTMSKAILKLAELLKPLHQRLRLKILQQLRVFADETTVKVQQKDRCKTSYFWTLVGGIEHPTSSPPLVYYQFFPDRKHENAKTLLGEHFRGFLHSDAYQAYENLINKDDNIVWQPCWAHARRKFFEAQTSEPIREKIVRLIDELFMIERQFWKIDKDPKLSVEDKKSAQESLRENKSKPLVEQIFAELKAFRYGGKFIPNGKINKACDYLLSRQSHFKNFLNHLELRIDNNVCERNIRPLTIGRKNWLFAGSKRGGEAIAIVSSLIQTCRNLEINPREYLELALRSINNTPEENLDDLLPQSYKKQK